MSRSKAWRNLMVCGINEALRKGLLSLTPSDNRWPNAGAEGQPNPPVFEFETGGKPALCYIADAGFDEVSVHVAYLPTHDSAKWVHTGNAGFHAGEAFAAGWLERRTGPFLQTSDTLFKCRRHLEAEIAAIEVEPAGYLDKGSLII
jgi:hypothetical protein